MPGSAVTIWTIGYEGLSLEQFLELLKANGIEHLVDIREAPISRKAGFAKAALSEAVERAGIRYSHVRALGCPKPIRDRHKETADWGRYTRDFKIYLAGQDDALAELRATARRRSHVPPLLRGRLQPLPPDLRRRGDLGYRRSDPAHQRLSPRHHRAN